MVDEWRETRSAEDRGCARVIEGETEEEIVGACPDRAAVHMHAGRSVHNPVLNVQERSRTCVLARNVLETLRPQRTERG